MVLVKIKPLGWVIILLAFTSAGVIGFLLSRSVPTVGDKAAIVPAAFSPDVMIKHIPASDKAVKNALEADDLDAAEKRVNKSFTFKGQIAQVYVPASNSVQLINFAENYKDAVSAAIEAPDYAKFPDPATLKGKDVLITGPLIVFNNHMEVKLTSPDQITIVDGMPAKKAPAAK